MTTGRIRSKDYRVYVDGYDMSGYGRSIGPLTLEYDEADLTAIMSDTVKGYLPNMANVNCGTLNCVFDNTATSGVVALAVTSGVTRCVTVAIGVQNPPADGDPCFAGSFIQTGFAAEEDGGAVVATIPYGGWYSNNNQVITATPWGLLLHAKAIRLSATGVNADAGFDNPTAGETLKGGFFVYHVFAGNGTATLSVDDSANNVAWVALAGATSGAIDCAVPTAAIVPIGVSTVRRYLRWQIAFGTATTVTFASAFMRAF